MKRKLGFLQVQVIPQKAKRFSDLIGKRHAVCIANGHAPRAAISHRTNDTEKCIAGDPSLEGAMETGRNSGTHDHPVLLRFESDLAEQCERLSDAVIQVLKTEALARGDHELDPADARRHGPLVAF